MKDAVLDGLWWGLGFLLAVLLLWAAAHLVAGIVALVHWLGWDYDGPVSRWRRSWRRSRKGGA